MKKLIALVIAFSPTLAFAQQLNDINTVAQKATNIGTLIIQIVISLAVLWIIVNVFRYLVAGGPDQRAEGGMAILYGVIALFVIFSIWGLVYILRNSFQFGQQGTPTQDINNTKLPPPPIVP